MADYGEDIPYEVVTVTATRDERNTYWKVGSSLQATDGLDVSAYARERAQDYVEGVIDSSEFEADLTKHYQSVGVQEQCRQAEADIVAARISSILKDGVAFVRGSSLVSLHSYLFKGVFDPRWVGRLRSVNLQKPEPILDGRTVNYLDWTLVPNALEYDFKKERAYRYHAPLDKEQSSHFARHIAGIWQIHPFREGNTRTMAIYSLLMLRTKGVPIGLTPFFESAAEYRDMLVRASFSSIELGINEDYSLIESFYYRVIVGGK